MDPTNYSWMGVLEFLQKQYQELEQEKTKWLSDRD
jgi:hypothetical protein